MKLRSPIESVRSKISPSRSPTPVNRPGTTQFTQLTTKQIDTIITSPYETGYTYASSLSYKRSLKAEDYVIPQLNRKQRYKFLYWELNTEWITNTDYITFPLRKYGQLSIDALTSLTSNSLGRIHDLLLVILSFLLALLQYTLTKVVQLLLLPVVLLLKASQMLMKVAFVTYTFLQYVIDRMIVSPVSSLFSAVKRSSCFLANKFLHWTNIFFYSLYGSLKSLTSGSAAGENMALKNVEIPKAMEASKIIANELRKSKRTQSITQKQSKGSDSDPEEGSSFPYIWFLILPLIGLLLYMLSQLHYYQENCIKCQPSVHTIISQELNETLLNEKIEKIVQERIASQLLINNERQSISTETILKEVIRSGDDLSILDRVRAMIREQIRKYDADRTGLPDYALESSGASVESTRCTVQYDEKSRTQKFFGIPLWYLSYSPRSVIQRKGYGASAGECWAYHGGHGFLAIKLSKRINVTAVSYEHLPVELSLDGHIDTAPKNFLIWSYQELDDTDSRVLLGNFTYDSHGEPLQMFEVQYTDPLFTPLIELETLTNYGSMVTCLYRFRVHGEPKPSSTGSAGNTHQSRMIDDEL